MSVPGTLSTGDQTSAWGILPALSPSLPGCAGAAWTTSCFGVWAGAAGVCSRLASTGPWGSCFEEKTFQACWDPVCAPGKSFAQGFLRQVHSSWRSRAGLREETPSLGFQAPGKAALSAPQPGVLKILACLYADCVSTAEGCSEPSSATPWLESWPCSSLSLCKRSVCSLR